MRRWSTRTRRVTFLPPSPLPSLLTSFAPNPAVQHIVNNSHRARASHVMKTCRGCRPAHAEMEFRRMSREHEEREARAAALNCATCGGAAVCCAAHAAMKYAAQQKLFVKHCDAGLNDSSLLRAGTCLQEDDACGNVRYIMRLTLIVALCRQLSH